MRLILTAVMCALLSAAASGRDLHADLDQRAEAAMGDVVRWRRDLHEHPELSNHEERTSALVAAHLRQLGFDEVRVGLAKNGVIGILRGGKPGKVVALRADMDALPVTEATGLPYASTVKATYQGREVGVMHACGHDSHTAMLMGVATVLSGLKKDIPGTVMFIFQPAEEGADDRSRAWGAEGMLQDGAFNNPKPDAVFGLHVMPGTAGLLGWQKGGATASSDTLHLTVKGVQTHGAMPWMGKDPVTVAGEIVVALQTIPSRQMNSSRAPAIVSIGSIHGGVRSNVIPGEVTMEGTIRTLDPTQREDFLARITRIAKLTAEASGLEAQVDIEHGYGVTYNNPDLVEQMLPSLKRVSTTEQLPATLASEDFSYFAAQVPGFFFTLGVNPPEVDPAHAPANHSPNFTVNESAMVIGVRAMASVAVDYLTAH